MKEAPVDRSLTMKTTSTEQGQKVNLDQGFQNRQATKQDVSMFKAKMRQNNFTMGSHLPEHQKYQPLVKDRRQLNVPGASKPMHQSQGYIVAAAFPGTGRDFCTTQKSQFQWI